MVVFGLATSPVRDFPTRQMGLDTQGRGIGTFQTRKVTMMVRQLSTNSMAGKLGIGGCGLNRTLINTLHCIVCGEDGQNVGIQRTHKTIGIGNRGQNQELADAPLASSLAPWPLPGVVSDSLVEVTGGPDTETPNSQLPDSQTPRLPATQRAQRQPFSSPSHASVREASVCR
jgi:hypothetical protein